MFSCPPRRAIVAISVFGFLAGLAVSTTTGAAAKSSGQLTLEQAVVSAVSWHPSIEEAVSKFKQQETQINIARSGYFPSVTGGMSLSYDDAAGNYQPQLNVSATQMLFDFGKVSSSVDAAIAGSHASHAEVLLAVDQLIRDTAYAVIETQRYRALLTVARDQLASITEISNLVQQRSDKGASTRSDQVQAQVRVQAAQSTVLQVQAQLEMWENNLAHLMGRKQVGGLSDNVPGWLGKACDYGEPDWDTVPAIMQAKAQQEQAVAELDESRADVFPTLSLQAGAGVDLQDIGERPDFSVGLNFSGKLFDGGASGSRADAAGYAMKAAGASLDNTRLQVSQAISQAQQQTKSLLQLLNTMTERDSLLQETSTLYRQQYFDLGTRTLLDLLNAEQELQQGRYDTVNTRQDIRKLRVDCLFNSGMARQSFALQGIDILGVSL